MKEEKINPTNNFASSDKIHGVNADPKLQDTAEPAGEIRPFDIQPFPIKRLRVGLMVMLGGYLIFLLGARPGLFGLDRSKVIGFVQITVFLIGLAVIALGSYYTLMSFWPKGKKSLLADFGSRVVGTGYVVCVFTSLADVFGFGSHPLPNVFFGPIQAIGVMIGMALIAIGFLMLVRFDRLSIQQS